MDEVLKRLQILETAAAWECGSYIQELIYDVRVAVEKMKKEEDDG